MNASRTTKAASIFDEKERGITSENVTRGARDLCGASGIARSVKTTRA